MYTHTRTYTQKRTNKTLLCKSIDIQSNVNTEGIRPFSRVNDWTNGKVCYIVYLACNYSVFIYLFFILMVRNQYSGMRMIALYMREMCAGENTAT